MKGDSSMLELKRTQTTQADETAGFPFNKEPLQLLTPAQQILFEKFGQGPRVSPAYSEIHLAIEAQARANPDALAASHQGQSMTYGRLNDLADQLASRLKSIGVLPGDHVALFVQRSLPMLVGMLAVLKVGAAYVPQDARIVPKPQLAHVIQKAQTRVILTLSHLQSNIPVAEGCVCLSIDEFIQTSEDQRFEISSIGRRPERDLVLGTEKVCFVLFTSGTTGMPNGVKVTHQNVCNILLTAPGNLGLRPGLKVSQILNIGFDMAAWEILGALSHGATLVIRGSDIAETLRQVDVVIATPSILAAVDASLCRQVKTVAVAGEPCPKPLADRWAVFCTFYNSCGPTEVTIVNTVQKYDPVLGNLNIGKPTPNNTVYILDDHLGPCAIGETGEMWAGGDCVSAGYINNPILTDERYKPDPFLGQGRMMFRTRDLGRWTADGELEHLGRTDDQVKIRGFRVELDSVSGALETTQSCAQAVTLKLDSRSLVSFVKPSNVDIDLAREMVAQKLPYYCMPSLIVALDDFPRTDRGKIDKRSLMTLALQKQQERFQENNLLQEVSV
jgi:D-alanine--poly(phosphoribitol) ligase subunit 1